jgi:hypothetical protein
LDLTRFILIALISEALWETSKLFWQQGKVNIDRIGAVVIGILLSLFANLDIFKALGTPLSIPILGELLTGLLISRGANFMHDILGSMGAVYNNVRKSN